MKEQQNVQEMLPKKAEATQTPATQPAAQTMTSIMNSLLDKEGFRKRFEDLLGKRTPQFVSSIVSLVNADTNLQQVFREAPITLVQAALKAATYDLPIEPSLGYAYIIPFNNTVTDDRGNKTRRKEASFILGYKGMIQLALRTGVYKTINALDVRQGELKKFNRLTEEIEIDFIEDEIERDKMPIVGWVGYYKLMNGTEKTVYMSRAQAEAHEQENRKGQYMGKGWREDFDSMALKTVLRRLIGKWGVMSIDYQQATPTMISAAMALAQGDEPDGIPVLTDAEYTVSGAEEAQK